MAVLARMPLGTVTLALLLHVRALTGSFAAAGAAVGSYLAPSAVTAPIIGRWIDRRGARGALIVTGIVSPAALLVLWIAGPLGLSTPTLWVVAAIAGAFAPPITVLTRTMWRYRFDDDDARKTAFALDAVLVEFSFTAGPALIALLLAIGSPAVAFSAAFVFTRARRADVSRVAGIALLAARSACGASPARAADRAAAPRGVCDDVPADLQLRPARNRLSGFRSAGRQSTARGRAASP